MVGIGVGAVVIKQLVQPADTVAVTEDEPTPTADEAATVGEEEGTDQPVDAEAELFIDDRKVGKVTAPNFSPVLKQSIALVQIEADCAEPGTKLEVRGPDSSCSATTHALPFYDPTKGNRAK